MNFDSAFFLFCFFPILFILYFSIPRIGFRNAAVILAGLIFYAFGGISSLVLLLVSALVNYLLGAAMVRAQNTKPIVTVGVVLNLAFLGVYKYLSFVLCDILGIDSVSLTLAAPVGISFFTFKAISYIIDVHRNKASAAGSPFDFLAYISFFPQLMAGPITRYSDFAPQLKSRSVTAEGAAAGLCRFICGMGEKLVISAPLGAVADKVFSSSAPDLRLAWVGAIAYMLQLLFDFAGYSNMAIGLGEIFGFKTPKNFDYPYISGSITEFWRRWHISLSTWFKDYLYIPLGGNRKGKYRTALNKAIVFTLCGLWHGAAFTYIVWGLWHGLLSALESLRVIDTNRLSKTAPGRVLCHVYTLLAVCLGFVIFRAGSLASGFSLIGAMFTFSEASAEASLLLHSVINARTLTAAALAAVLSTPAAGKLWGKLPNGAGKSCAGYVFCILLLVLCITEVAAGGFSPFIYFQF